MVNKEIKTKEFVSPNFDTREEQTPIDMLVLHYTGMVTGELALNHLTDPESKVSAHYLIEENGCIYNIVPEEFRAWHAGVSFWRGHQDINSRSIGIELVNPGHEFGYRPFPELQIQALETLALDILLRYPIPKRNVVGHSDIAPSRKLDPGELFSWQRLANIGIGSWPQPAEVPTKNVMESLSLIGYDVSNYVNALAAFQRHFRPEAIHGVADKGTCYILQGLVDVFENR